MPSRIAAALSVLLLSTTALGAAPAPAKAPADAPPPPAADIDAPLPELPEPAAKLDDPFMAELEGYKADAIARARTVEAVLPLLRAYSLRDRLSTLAPLARLYGQFVEWGAVPPEVRSLARYLLAQVQRSRGRLPSAQEQTARLGFVTRSWIAGPFDNEGKSGCDMAYPPEKGVELAARFPGKVREIGWRKLPELSKDGYVDLGAVLSPTDETVTYALAVVEVAADQKAVLHLGASGASRLFLNGVKVLQDDAYHPARFDQSQVGVTLKKGANRVLLKLCQQSGPAGYWLRVSGLDGDALSNATLSAPDTLPPLPKAPTLAREVQAAPTALDAFRKKADLSAKDPAALARAVAEYAELLFVKRVSDPKDQREAAEAARAAQLAPKELGPQMLAAATADDSNERRRYLEAALANHPLHPAATLALARHLMGHDQSRRALDLLLPAVQKQTAHYPLSLGLARAYDEVGLARHSAQLIASLARTYRDRPEVVREAARLARRHDQMRDSVSLLRVAIALRFDDLESRRLLVSSLSDLGEVEAALKEQREICSLDPWDVRSWLRLGELSAANGRTDEAKAAFAKAIEIAPEDAEVFERQGQALTRSGETKEAIAAFTRSLEAQAPEPAGQGGAQGPAQRGPRFRRGPGLRRGQARRRGPAHPWRGRRRARRLHRRQGAAQRPLLALRADRHPRADRARRREAALAVGHLLARPAGAEDPQGAGAQARRVDHRVAPGVGALALRRRLPALLRRPRPHHQLPQPGPGRRARAGLAAGRHRQRQPALRLLRRRQHRAGRPAQGAVRLRAPGARRPDDLLQHLPGEAGEDRAGQARRLAAVPLVGAQRPRDRARARHARRLGGLRAAARLDLLGLGGRQPLLLGPGARPTRAHRRDQGGAQGDRRRAAQEPGRADHHPRGLRVRGDQDPLRGPRVRHPRLQAVQGGQGARAPLRRLQGQGVADARAARGGGHRLADGALAHAPAGGDRPGAGVAGHLRPRHPLRAQARLVARRHRGAVRQPRASRPRTPARW
ncbi:MAG: hypothetical protein QM765_39760 [Myxococcales bacterium]